MEALITGLVLAAVTGLAWLAYHHPVQFLPIAVFLKWGTTIFFALASAWGIGANQAFITMLPYLSDSQKARDALGPITMDWLWGPIAFFATLGYLQFLESFVTTLKAKSN